MFLVCVEMKRLGHLRGSVSSRAGISHGQAGRDAVRREEQITVNGFKPGIKIQSEGRVASAKFFNLVGAHCFCWVNDQCGHN